jgi:hypothetical protein
MLRSLAFLLVLATAALAADAPNTLSKEEQAAGWKLLFDGTSLKGWTGLPDKNGKTELPSGWVPANGELALNHEPGTTHGDIVTEEKFSDFEVVWEWKIAVGGNSGLKYNLPDPTKNVGCEYQLLDDERHPDAKLHDGTRTTGGLYDVIAPDPAKKYKPAGEWNVSRIVVKGNHVEHYLNGGLTVAYDFGSDDMKARIAASKFNKTPGWGEKTSSPILLQDHHDDITFRNIKILPGK